MTWWRALIAWLTWLSADPAAVDREAPRAVAAVAYAYAATAREEPAPPPDPGPEPPAPTPAVRSR